jgi:2-polyprenyl-3-methyl-5-hydroxy-6-metoxy-1,4-benzoquinol methylase
MKIEKNTLVELYQVISKHSNYQILPNLLKGILDQKDLTVKSRFESERFEFMNAFVDFKDKHVLDIGGNTGYFGFSTLEQGAKSVKIIEGNKAHAEFVEAASNYLEVNLSVENRYLEFNLQDNFSEKFDVVFLLNVIHHLGDDYGDKNLAMSEAKKIMKKSIQYFIDKTEKLIFSASKLASLIDLPLLMVTYLMSKLSVLDRTILMRKFLTRTVSSLYTWNGSILNHLCS